MSHQETNIFVYPYFWNVSHKLHAKTFSNLYHFNKRLWYFNRRSQCPRGLRRTSATARLLRSWVRIPPGAWMFVCCECCVLSGRGLCDELITRPEESYRLWCVVVCDLETSRMRRPWPALGRSASGEKKINSNRLILKNKLIRMTARKSLSIPFLTLFLPFHLVKLILFIRTRGRVALTVWMLSLGVWNSALYFDRGRLFFHRIPMFVPWLSTR